MKYRLIAVDLDGTLLDNDGKLNERTIKAARAAMDTGAKFVLSSGRMPPALRSIGLQLNVNAPAVCYNGGAVVDLATNEAIYKTPVPIDLARDIARAAEDMGMYLHAFVHGAYIAPCYTAMTERYESLSGVKANVVNAKISEAMDEAPMKLLILEDPAIVDKALPVLQEKFAGRARILRSQNFLIECVDKNTSKSGALTHLCGVLGIDPSETLSFGDGQNDLDMLLWAGQSYVMDNASDKLKAASPNFRIAPSNAEQGVAQVLEALIAAGEIGA